MGILDRLFGRKSKESQPLSGTAPTPPPFVRGRAPASLEEFARSACRSAATLTMTTANVCRLVDLLSDALRTEYPDLDSGEVFSHANAGLSLRCPNCGEFNDSAKSMLYLAGTDTMRNAVFGGPNVAALGQGRCPGCGGSTVVATFDPAGIQARHAAVADSAAEAGDLAVASPVLTYACLGSLTVSPDEQKAAWVCARKGAQFEIVIAETTSGSELVRFRRAAHEYPPRCLFVGNDRLLVAARPTDDLKQANIALFDAADGTVKAEIDLGDCYFSNPCAHHETRTVAAEMDTFNLIVLQTQDDKLTYEAIETGQIYSPGPRFGPDGKVYVIVHYALYRIEGKERAEITRGHNCICFDPAGKVYCGGGHSDRSGNSALHVADLKTGETFEVAWDCEPIDVIEPAGSGQLLVANIVSAIHAGRYPNATVTLLSLPDGKRKWTIEIADLPPGKAPVLVSAPDEGWAVIQTGKLLKRVSLSNGQPVQRWDKKPSEAIEARWLASSKRLLLARTRDGAGELEAYDIA